MNHSTPRPAFLTNTTATTLVNLFNLAGNIAPGGEPPLEHSDPTEPSAPNTVEMDVEEWHWR